MKVGTWTQETYQVHTATDPETHVVFAEVWVVQGRRHRSGGPAVISRDSKTGAIMQEDWFSDGRRHRDDGPAVIIYDAKTGEQVRREWYLNGRPVPAPRKRTFIRRPAQQKSLN